MSSGKEYNYAKEKWKPHSFNFSCVTEWEIKRLVTEICIAKSSAIDGLSTSLLKDAFEILSFELTCLYNSCMRSGG